jgi:hypothetical protein
VSTIGHGIAKNAGQLSAALAMDELSEVLGRPVRFQQVSGEAYKATLLRYGLSEAWAQGIVDMAAAQDDGVYDVESHTPRSATSFRQWCQEELRPAVRPAVRGDQ